MVTEPRRIAAVSLAHRVAEKRGCPPPGAVGSSAGYMVRNNRRGHLPSCQIIYMTIGMLLKMLVSDRGGTAAAADDVNDGSLSYGNDDDDVDNKE
jgi:HrpA-like RNA helicase